MVHDPNNITFQNRCQSGDKKYFRPTVRTTTSAFLSPTTQLINPTLYTDSNGTSETPTPFIVAKNHHNSSIVQVSSTDLISQLSSRTSTPNEADPFLEAFDVVIQGDISTEVDISIPDWFSLNRETIYDKLNPRTKQGTSELRSWHKKCVDGAGKPLTSIGIVVN
jgi:hypothetical protein